ncbi:hypothetical protein F5B21DRAFT_502097 [Xylaria acuta]|nr:hypothetical protein F5B21DRAFT_502097 [Xylaria acuta]
MYILPFILASLVSLFASLGATTPVQIAAAAIGNTTKIWTLDEMERKTHHNNQTCRWHFSITESVSPPSYNDPNIITRCRFPVKVLKHQDCRAGNFGMTQCNHRNPDFFISGGHDKDGFLTLVVANTYENGQAYFGYLDSVLDAGGIIPPQTAPVKSKNFQGGGR